MTEEGAKNIKKIVGDNIKGLRKSKNLTQEQLAEALNYGRGASISKMENENTDITISILEEISKYFGVSVAFMCEEHNYDNIDLNMAIKERIEAEQYEAIKNAAVITNNVFVNLVPELYQEDFATEIGNILRPSKKS